MPMTESTAAGCVIATGLLAEFHGAGILDWADVHVATRLADLGGETSDEVRLAAALAVWAVRSGSVCVDLATVAGTVFDIDESVIDSAQLRWPEPEQWVAVAGASPIVDTGSDPERPLRLDGTRLYLARYWREEELVRTELAERCRRPVPAVDTDLLEELLLELFGSGPRTDRQRAACRTALTSWVSVIAGGPGTGKTTTIARLYAVLHRLGFRRISLAAPTGKASVRMADAVRAELGTGEHAHLAAGVEAATLHRLLGHRPLSRWPDRTPAGPVPADVVIVDEMSMVSLSMMARLVRGTAADTRLVLVGDPGQLASVEAGAVLADLTESASQLLPVVELDSNWRFGSQIDALAAAVRAGDPDAVMAALRAGGEAVRFVETDLTAPPPQLRDRIVTTGAEIHRAALRGDEAAALAALMSHRLLCGHRTGRFGAASWNRQAAAWLAESVPGYGADGDWSVGRPILVNRNTTDLGLFNGDTGVVVASPEGRQVAFGQGRLVSPYWLDDVTTVHAMTVHKSQGSQFAEVSLIVPPPGSPLLVRQLLYTAITRAATGITLYGTEEAIREAVARPALRASGLRSRL